MRKQEGISMKVNESKKKCKSEKVYKCGKLCECKKAYE